MAQNSLFSPVPEAGHVVGGRYCLVRKLSEGGSGIVWKAKDTTDRDIALKFLKWSPTKSKADSAEKFKNEFTILKSLSHPNIAQIYDFGKDADTGLYFFTSELLTAGDFRNLVMAPVDVLEDLLLQALRALEYLRAHRLLHLDIKPHNLLLRKSGDKSELALIDFDLATFRPPDRPGGTPNYMAPELISMRIGAEEGISFGAPDHRSDLYSLGVTFYHCLSGVQPFLVTESSGRIDKMATLKKHLSFDPPPPSTHRAEIPAYLDRIIMKLMARFPDDRYPSAIVAAQALQYSSPRKHAPESLKTLLAYLPKEGRLIGRKNELNKIENTLSAIAKGESHTAPVIAISGGDGVGRTRLIKALKPIAQRLEMETNFVGEGDPLSAVTIENILAQAEAKKSGVYAVLIDDLERAFDTSVDNDLAIIHELNSLSRRLRLQQRLPESSWPRIIFIFTLNSEKISAAAAMLDLNFDDSLCHLIELKNFKHPEVTEYLAAVLGEDPDKNVVSELLRCTNGNPRFLTEHLEQMIKEGRLFSLAGRPDATTLKTIGIDFTTAVPSRSLAETVREKFRELSSGAQNIALMLACLQRPAGAEELYSLTDASADDLLYLIESRLVRRLRTNGRIWFVNALAPRVIAESVQLKTKEVSHDKIAAHLKKKRGTKHTELDMHIAYGSNVKLRLPALLRLAEKKLAANDGLIAASHFEAALRMTPQNDATKRAEILGMIGKSYERAHRDNDARKTYEQLKNISAPPQLKQNFKSLALEKLGLISMRRRELSDSRKYFRKALKEISGIKGTALARIRLENRLAGVDLRDGRIEQALERFKRSAKLADRMLTDKELKSISNNELGEALLRAHQVDDAILILTRDLARAKRDGNAERGATIHYLLGNALRHESIKRYNEARQHYREGLAIARDRRFIEIQVRILNGLGNLEVVTKRPDRAMKFYNEALKLAQQMESETTNVEIMIGMGLASQKLNDHEHTIEYFEAALDFSSAPKGESAGLIRRYHPTILVALADSYFQKRDFIRAEEYLKKLEVFDSKRRLASNIRYSLYGTYAELFLERGEKDRAKKLLPTIEAIAKVLPNARSHCAVLKLKLEHM